jgi:hypothetical protein
MDRVQPLSRRLLQRHGRPQRGRPAENRQEARVRRQPARLDRPRRDRGGHPLGGLRRRPPGRWAAETLSPNSPSHVRKRPRSFPWRHQARVDRQQSPFAGPPARRRPHAERDPEARRVPRAARVVCRRPPACRPQPRAGPDLRGHPGGCGERLLVPADHPAPPLPVRKRESSAELAAWRRALPLDSAAARLPRFAPRRGLTPGSRRQAERRSANWRPTATVPRW